MPNIRILETLPPAVELFRPRLGDLRVRAATATGVLLCVDAQEGVHVFDPETTEPEALGFDWEETMAIAAGDPEIFDESVRLTALAALGPIADDQVYSLKVERIVGGKQEVGNMEIRSLDDHLRVVHAVVEAVEDDPVGTVYGAVRIVRK